MKKGIPCYYFDGFNLIEYCRIDKNYRLAFDEKMSEDGFVCYYYRGAIFIFKKRVLAEN